MEIKDQFHHQFMQKRPPSVYANNTRGYRSSLPNSTVQQFSSILHQISFKKNVPGKPIQLLICIIL